MRTRSPGFTYHLRNASPVFFFFNLLLNCSIFQSAVDATSITPLYESSWTTQTVIISARRMSLSDDDCDVRTGFGSEMLLLLLLLFNKNMAHVDKRKQAPSSAEPLSDELDGVLRWSLRQQLPPRGFIFLSFLITDAVLSRRGFARELVPIDLFDGTWTGGT